MITNWRAILEKFSMALSVHINVAGCPAGMSLIAWAGGDEVQLDLAVSLARYCGIAL
jgi:hypothetical protein